jgi:hypothetical protein
MSGIGQASVYMEKQSVNVSKYFYVATGKLTTDATDSDINVADMNYAGASSAFVNNN